MLALLASYLVVFYFLIPSRIFRISALYLELKKFRRTQVEEITFAFLFAVLPFCLVAIALLSIQRLGSGYAFASWRDYRDFFEAAYSEKLFEEDTSKFWRLLPDVLVGQACFLTPYYVLCGLEARIFVALVRKWGDWHERFPRYKRYVGKLLGNISEWDMILTAFNFPAKDRRIAVADVLVDGLLYQGVVKDHFLGEDGGLSGIFLASPYRFNRPGYHAAKRRDAKTKTEDFWVLIPGENLYIPKEKISNMNVWYPLENTKLPSSATPAMNKLDVTRQLADEGLLFTVEPTEVEQKLSSVWWYRI